MIHHFPEKSKRKVKTISTVNFDSKMTKKEKDKVIRSLEKAMREAAHKLNFEEAARLRDVIMEIRADK